MHLYCDINITDISTAGSISHGYKSENVSLTSEINLFFKKKCTLQKIYYTYRTPKIKHS